jgi:hypothetical protein
LVGTTAVFGRAAPPRTSDISRLRNQVVRKIVAGEAESANFG